MKIPGIGVVDYNKPRSKNTQNNQQKNSFKGRIDTEMRNILVERPILCNVGHSGYTTYYYDEIIGYRTDDLYRMVNIYRPYSWEQSYPTSPLGTPNFNTFKKIPKENMFKNNGRFRSRNDEARNIAPYGFNCDTIEYSAGRPSPDYLQNHPFRLTPPIRYEQGRPVYQTGEPVYKPDEYDHKIYDVRTEVWEGAIGEIGRPLNRLDSLEDKLAKLNNKYNSYDNEREKTYKKYNGYAETANDRARSAFTSKTSSIYSKFEEIFRDVSRVLTNQLDDKMSQIYKETKKIENEIKLIEDAKKRHQYIDLSTKNLYENCEIVQTARRLSKREHYRDVIVSLPDRTLPMQCLCHDINGDWHLEDETLIRKYIDRIMYPERIDNIVDALKNRDNLNTREDITNTFVKF